MFLTWLRNRRRRRLLAEPFPPAWEEIVRERVPYAARLTDAERQKLRDDLRLFVAEKNWEGCEGLHVTDEMRVTIAGNACMLVLGHDVDSFRRVTSVLVYPSAFQTPGWSTSFNTTFGLASYMGPVVLSWASVMKGVRHPADGRNVVLHEFAHHLDFLDWACDGIPDVGTAREHRKWREIIALEYRKLVEAAQRDEVTVIDRYGAANPGEFYAVATECFFERPVEMRSRHPALYGILRRYYRLDPAARA
jgi:Mlc titration factor MtfA (ptsG expression regulator)